jgi:hypothetical protein
MTVKLNVRDQLLSVEQETPGLHIRHSPDSLQASNNDHESGLKQKSVEPGDAPRLCFGHTPGDYMLPRHFSGSIKRPCLDVDFYIKKIFMSEITMQDHLFGIIVLCSSLVVQSI